VIEILLSDQNDKYFNDMYPLFYKNKDGGDAIDIVLQNNLVRPINKILDYLVKYQNKPVYSKIIQHNFIDMLNRSISVTNLLNSEIMISKIESDMWPSQSDKGLKIIKPYNGSPIHLMYKFGDIFKEFQSDLTKEEKANQKSLKIKYTISNLPLFSTKDSYLIDSLLSTDEIEIFGTKAVQDFTKFHWESYAKWPILLALLNHITYVYLAAVYINERYNHRKAMNECKVWLNSMMIPLAISTLYSMRQLTVSPFKYLG